MWSCFGRGDGCRLVDEPDVLRFETPVAHVPYNAVLRCTTVDRAVLDEILEAYRSRGVPVVWIVHPSAPTGLRHQLVARGLEEAERITGMAMELAGLPDGGLVPAGVEVEEVGPDDHGPYLELLTWRYGLPPDGVETLRSIMRAARFGADGSPNRAWVACGDGEVLSKVTLHLDGRSAGIYGLATRPEARGLGLGRLLTLRAFEAARRAGVELGVLHSTPMAASLYASLGFHRVAPLGLWAEPDTLQL
jgi:GNAT superfamily N-acetyltransferase